MMNKAPDLPKPTSKKTLSISEAKRIGANISRSLRDNLIESGASLADFDVSEMEPTLEAYSELHGLEFDLINVAFAQVWEECFSSSSWSMALSLFSKTEQRIPVPISGKRGHRLSDLVTFILCLESQRAEGEEAFLSTTGLADVFNVSDETARLWLIDLQKLRMLIKTCNGRYVPQDRGACRAATYALNIDALDIPKSLEKVAEIARQKMAKNSPNIC